MWMRLKNPDGDVYSFGLYRERKLDVSDHMLLPMKVQRCEFQSPGKTKLKYLTLLDVCEFWGEGSFNTLSIEITAEQFVRMKKQVEQDNMQQRHLYQALNGNCVNYTLSICKIGNH